MEEVDRLAEIFKDAPGTPEQKFEALLSSVAILSPIAKEQADASANGEFLKILFELLLKFLPIILKLLV